MKKRLLVVALAALVLAGAAAGIHLYQRQRQRAALVPLGREYDAAQAAADAALARMTSPVASGTVAALVGPYERAVARAEAVRIRDNAVRREYGYLPVGTDPATGCTNVFGPDGVTPEGTVCVEAGIAGRH
jgi:type IV secretory pathway TrbF-like protein